jgi:hypothetical protein
MVVRCPARAAPLACSRGDDCRGRLADAVERFRREEGAYANSHDSYRRGARHSGAVYIGGVSIPARKDRSVWVVEGTGSAGR